MALEMKFTERKQKLEYLLEKIQKGRCLSLESIARGFCVSKRTAKRMIAELREEGHFIVYCKFSKRFCIEDEVEKD